MPYRLTKNQLFAVLEEWNRRLKRKVHLIACGGTAMTLLDIKASTKDVDFIAPVLTEYDYLTREGPKGTLVSWLSSTLSLPSGPK